MINIKILPGETEALFQRFLQIISKCKSEKYTNTVKR